MKSCFMATFWIWRLPLCACFYFLYHYKKLMYLTVAMHSPQGSLRPGSQLGVNVPKWSFWDHLCFLRWYAFFSLGTGISFLKTFLVVFFPHHSSHRHLRICDFEDRFANNWCSWWSEWWETWKNFLACTTDWMREIVLFRVEISWNLILLRGPVMTIIKHNKLFLPAAKVENSASWYTFIMIEQCKCGGSKR